MRKICLIFIQTVMLLVFSNAVHAQSEFDYFRAEVPVKSQDSKERRQAARQALRDVILRVSGSASTLEHPELQKKIESAISYVEQFQYLSLDDERLLNEGYIERLSLTFSPGVVKKLLYETRQPYWSVNRPKTLVWLVEDTADDGKQLVNKQSPGPVVDSLLKAARKRGVPLVFPLLDLDDQFVVTPEDVWMFDEEKITEASERYQADVILVGRYSTTSRGEVWATWQFFHSGTTRSYDSRTDLSEARGAQEIGEIALNPLANYLASRYAIVPTMEAQASLVMQLASIQSFGDYYSALEYLDRLAAIADVSLVAIREDTMLLYLDAESEVEKLVSVLELDGQMEPVVRDTIGEVPAWQQMPLGSFENPLNYQWVN